MNWDIIQWVGGFLIAALGGYVAYKRLNYERKESMASTIEKLALSSDKLAARIATLESEKDVWTKRVRHLEEELEKVKEENALLKTSNDKLQRRITKLVKRLKEMGEESDL